MHMFLLPLATLVASYASAATIGASRGTARSYECANETIVSQETLESGIVVTQRQCLDTPVTPKRTVSNELEKRQQYTDYLCADNGGTNCYTDCYGGKTGGPNQNDCNFIANTIGSTSNDIQIYTGTSWTYVWNSCEARFFNQVNKEHDVIISICPSAFAGTINWLSGDCNAANDAHGGKCISYSDYATAPDGCDAAGCTHAEWFIDVIHS